MHARHTPQSRQADDIRQSTIYHSITVFIRSYNNKQKNSSINKNYYLFHVRSQKKIKISGVRSTNIRRGHAWACFLFRHRY